MKLYLRILGYLRPHGRLFAISIVAMTVFAALDAITFTMIIPFFGILFGMEGAVAQAGAVVGKSNAIERLISWAIGDLITQNEPLAALRNVVLVLFGITIVKNIALYVQNYSVQLVQGRVTRDLRNDIYTHLLRLGFPYFQRTRVGQIISRATVDVESMRGIVTTNLAKALSSVIQTVVYLTMLFLISWKLTLVAVLFLPPMLGLWARFRKRLRRGVLRVLDAVGEVSAHLQETISGVRVVKASGAEGWERSRFEGLTRMHYTALKRNERWRQFFSPATEVITSTAILVLILYGSHLVLNERDLSAKSFLAALLLAARLMSPVKYLGQFPSMVQPGLASAERAFELLDAPAEIVDRAGARAVGEFRESLRFEGVDFAFTAGEPVLRGIDLEIRAGEVVALVGPSGAGKSTFADLVPRFHDPTAGRVTLDGVDLRDLRLTELRGQLGIVTQETILFHDTVRNNIAYGRPDAPLEAVEEAARAANAHQFIAEMRDGYETVLGEKGLRLSGGQRQRIAIARALLRNPPILILDEATSALDTESERLVQQAIDELLHDRTVLVIAHRLSTVRKASKIVVMEEGLIVQQGTHDELLARGGTYSRLYHLQFSGDSAAPPPAAAV